ncbi:MAG: hypothetical protein M2R45_04303 [Verrucomicrobia subdivision 3 bacterium]|nr:hypothetical protein [Limisphaerales bacterium]MCS1417218.1 hypothetical protein [Limisphaerales bacterium]
MNASTKEETKALSPKETVGGMSGKELALLNKVLGKGEYMLSLTIGLILAVAISFFFIKAYQPRLTLKTRWPVRLASSARRHLDLNPNSEIICILN